MSVKPGPDPSSAVAVRPFFVKGDDPFEGIEWETRTATIGEPENPVFKMEGVEAPKEWSQRATDIVASKYFRKAGVPQPDGSFGAETSVRQLVTRIANAIALAGQQQGYYGTVTCDVFRRELIYLLVHQMGAFNSPVWFNVGLSESYGIKGDAAGNWIYETMPTDRDDNVVRSKDAYERPQGSACQPYHSLVLTERGLMPIGQIVEENAVGLKVHDGSGWTDVKATKANGVKLVHRIRLADGREIEATADHLVCAHSQRRKRAEEWVPVGDLKLGMYMRACVKAEGAARDTRTASTEDVAKAALAGWLQTDGYVGQPQSASSLIVEFETINDQERAWVLGHLDTVFPDVHRNTIDEETDDPKVDYKRIRLYGEPLRRFVDEYELVTRNPSQSVPQLVLRGTPAAQIAYLRSVFQADGYVSLRESGARVGASKCSRKMMQGVQQLLARLGIYARLRRAEEKRAGRHDQWVVVIGNLSERERFAELIGFIAADKQGKLDESLDLDGKTCPPVRYVPIESITSTGEQEVYDIQTGTEKYLCGDVLVHNCFIRTVEDDIMSIARGIVTEMRLFKWGSGVGANFSNLRARGEPLSGGGKSSGLMSFLKVYDASAGSIKSGGVTRRASKIVVLDADHPDIEEFVEWKAREEEKAAVLRQAGYSGGIEGEAYSTVSGQNANNSVRATDEFMRAVEGDGEWATRWRVAGTEAKRMKARDLMRKLAKATWACGDPGMQFHDTFNKWNTVPEFGEIRSTNPCAEFAAPDNTACNLASLNLHRFFDADGNLDTATFQQAVRLFILAQEILVDYSSYPTAEIARNSHKLRPLGLGYANLGGLLMRLGMSYDSAAGRTLCGAITALMSGTAWLASAEIAKALDKPFFAFGRNRGAMLQVGRMHRDALANVPESPIRSAAKVAWDQAIALGELHGYRNSQLTLLAPTGTISFLMDCDTTGIEPGYAIITSKKLAGGGHMKIVIRMVARALVKLGYEASLTEIMKYVEEKGTIKGAPYVKPADYPVFSCAMGALSLPPRAHLKMVAAAQPFLSGSVSKTVNVPEDTPVEQIESLFIEAWQLGLKAVAIYRDNSKGVQVLTVGKDGGQEAMPKRKRKRLAKKRQGWTQEATVGGHKVYLRTGHYDNGQLGEIFIDMQKQGATVGALLNIVAICTSLGLQHGVPLEEYVDAFIWSRFQPAGVVRDHEHVRMATSVIDYIFKVLAVEYLGRHDLAHVHPLKGDGTVMPAPKTASDGAQHGSAPCHKCGGLTETAGTCDVCQSCGETSGCG